MSLYISSDDVLDMQSDLKKAKKVLSTQMIHGYSDTERELALQSVKDINSILEFIESNQDLND